MCTVQTNTTTERKTWNLGKQKTSTSKQNLPGILIREDILLGFLDKGYLSNLSKSFFSIFIAFLQIEGELEKDSLAKATYQV